MKQIQIKTKSDNLSIFLNYDKYTINYDGSGTWICFNPKNSFDHLPCYIFPSAEIISIIIE